MAQLILLSLGLFLATLTGCGGAPHKKALYEEEFKAEDPRALALSELGVSKIGQQDDGSGVDCGGSEQIATEGAKSYLSPQTYRGGKIKVIHEGNLYCSRVWSI